MHIYIYIYTHTFPSSPFTPYLKQKNPNPPTPTGSPAELFETQDRSAEEAGRKKSSSLKLRGSKARASMSDRWGKVSGIRDLQIMGPPKDVGIVMGSLAYRGSPLLEVPWNHP